MPEEIYGKYIDNLKPIYGKRLDKVILFGSYARGDHSPSSDVDIMILLDIPPEEISAFDEALCDMTFDFNMEHGVDFSPVTQNSRFFQKWENILPFYANVKKEGILLYG